MSSGAMPVSAANNDAEMKKFIDNLMAKMTLEEKLGQLNLPTSGDITTGAATSSDVAAKIEQGKVGGLFNIKGVDKIREVQRLAIEKSRLKIPLIFGMDVIHGYETTFPIPLALAATWNMNAIEQSAQMAAREASADGINWTFSPMVDVSREPRWGRISEGVGEDPYLGGQIAKAMVYGYQGKGADRYKLNSNIMACVKHYALYGAVEAGREYNTVDMSRQRMFNDYMYPYQAAVEAGVGSVMAAFNEVDGVPATANKYLLDDILRKKWGFDGFVVTDFTAIQEMVAHGIGDFETVSARALAAGIDMDMVSEGFLNLQKALKDGKVTMAQIDQACRRVLEAKYVLGLFKNPYKYCDSKRAKTEIFTPANRAVARQVATESFVLLKNDNNTLPLAKKGKIAVIGPLGNTRENMPGTWSVATPLDKSISLMDGLKAAVGDKAEVNYAKGSHLVADSVYENHATMFGRSLHRDQEKRTNQQMLDEAINLANQSDVVIAALGESSEMSGESSSRTNIDIPDVQKDLLKALMKTGKPVVLVLFNGRPLTLNWEKANVPAILDVWFGGSEAGSAIADVLFGNVNPSGKLPVTFPQNVGQIPIYYNHKNTGRPLPEGGWFQKFKSNYLDVSNEPAFPFGFGLSYTNFGYSDVKLSSPKMNNEGFVTASVTVTNTGKVDGAEVVQLYIRDIVATSTRPVKELKGFQKIFLKAGESKTIDFKITTDLLKYYNDDLQYVAEPGDFEVMIGGSSADVKSAKFTLE
ncbi:MAG: beta-glucosidase BglX [Dysgonamonadaceae bacterium]